MDRQNLERKKLFFMIMKMSIDQQMMVVIIFYLACLIVVRHYQKHCLKSQYFNRDYYRSEYLERLVYSSDKACFEQLRMDRYTFRILCGMLGSTGRLNDTKNVKVDEQVAMFLHIIAHHVKNRVINFRFMRSGETISRHFNKVLNAVIRLQRQLFKVPEPVPENSTDEKWKWFKNCLGALDGTYIRMNVPEVDKPRYRSRKGEISTNVLGVCAQDMQFIYVLPGWEGSAADGRVLRDTVSRRNGLRVPNGYYYLADAGYTNGNGFLAPYRGQRYHLNDWREGHQPTTPAEFFNMKHSSARNVIERCFGLLKLRWAILRSPSWYPIKVQGRIIIACCLLHNLIRREMPVDPLEADIEEIADGATELHGEPITVIKTSNQWTTWRNNLANQMFNEWMASRQGRET